ncbi:hypothetical protein PIB30_043726 [Stylosanthes scabra]|uniref:Uncharacterized protein n=1 Tax=Stylosanthes scabra TaxID=79078 RepID=A0ABU6VE61_9FABA|nr:hypothetical protein [Stylosanthes scabra]
MVGIAEDIIVRVGQLSIPTDFHVIRTAKNNNRSNPQKYFSPHCHLYLKKKAFIKLGRRNLWEKSSKKKLRIRQLLLRKRRNKRPPPQLKEASRKRRLQGSEEEEARKRKEERNAELNCTSFKDLLGKLKRINSAIVKNGGIGVHLVDDNSKWK